MNIFKHFTTALIAAGSLMPVSATAQTGADFYKGKTVTYIVATAPGGGYDLYGRFVAEYMQRNLPGSTFVVKNVPGAGHLTGANTIYASAHDGLTIGTFNTGLIYNQLIGLDGVKFDLTKMSWVGKASSDPQVILVAAQSPIKDFADLRNSKQQLNFATSGIGSAAYVQTLMITNAFSLPIKILTGYNGNDPELAMRRGEVTGNQASRSSVEQFVKNGYGRFIVQMGGKETDVPQLRDQVQEKERVALPLIALIEAQSNISRLTVGPPGIPKDRLEALQTAFRKAMEDPELQAKVIKAGSALDPAYGDEVLAMVKAALDQPPATVSMLKQALEQK